MKTILFGIISMAMIASFTAQNLAINKIPQDSTKIAVSCQLDYASDKKIMLLKQSESISACNEINLNSLPPKTEPLTDIDLNLKSGNYTFFVNSTLELPVQCYIYIEDQCTGAVFNVEYGNSYTFVVKRSIPKRFKLYIAKASSASISTKSK